jgi:hypothetical protein
MVLLRPRLARQAAGLRRCIDARWSASSQLTGMSVVHRFAASDAERARVSPLVARAGWTTLIGFVVVGFGVWLSDSWAAVPAGAGLAVLAVSDAVERRVSPRVVAVTGLLTLCVFVADAGVSHEWFSVTRSVVLAALVGVAMLGGWLVSRGAVAFGDVPLTVVAVLVPAWVSVGAVCWMLLGTLIVGGALVMARRVALLSLGSSASSVPFAVALLGGWVVGLCVG